MIFHRCVRRVVSSPAIAYDINNLANEEEEEIECEVEEGERCYEVMRQTYKTQKVFCIRYEILESFLFQNLWFTASQ